MKKKRLNSVFDSLKKLRPVWLSAGALLCIFSYEVISETLTMTTYYPSPVGVYRKLTTTAEAKLATKGGNVEMVMGGGSVGIGKVPESMLDVGGDTNINGQLGVGGDAGLQGNLNVSGGASVGAKLSVGGKIVAPAGVQLGQQGVCNSSAQGLLAYRDATIKFCDGSTWQELGGGPAAPTGPQSGDITVREGTSCGSGEKIVSRFYEYASCSGNTCWWRSGNFGCSTNAQWVSDGQSAPSCDYPSIDDCSNPYTRSHTCTASNITRVKCQTL